MSLEPGFPSDAQARFLGPAGVFAVLLGSHQCLPLRFPEGLAFSCALGLRVGVLIGVSFFS